LLATPLVGAGEIWGIYLAFLALVTLGVFEAVSPLGSAFQFLGRTLGAAERLFDVADSEPDLKGPEHPHPAPADHTLRFDRVSFRYDDGSPAALNDVSFTLKPGRKVAVVGPSGAGKSTLVNLILRFWDPQSGEVQLGNYSLRGYAQEDVRALVGVVPQRVHVFNDTLRANLLLAKPDADDAALTKALSRAGLYELFERLPEGVDSYAGEQGARLSGGERQRLAIARAFLKDAPLLVLDEPTANLDTVTERELLKALQRLGRGRSVLLITHRLVAMEEMDEILVLDEGCVVEQGTHEQLRTAGGLYARLLDIQRQMLGSIES
jgi:ATP-binding cassette subfamily C protein CydC